MKTNLIEQAENVFAPTYSRFPIVFEKGRGCVLTDIDGKDYIDFLAGIAVCNLGHAHPDVAKALTLQAGKLFHVSNLYYTIPQTALAERLIKLSFADKIFFCNSGAEANEAAIKLARKYSMGNGNKERYRIIAMEKSFHGRTMATLSATGQPKIRAGFEPVLDGFDFVPFNNIEALESAITPSTCAVMAEPIQGEGGLRCPGPDYLKTVKKICEENDLLLIFDEIQTGMGRTGKLFAYEHFNITPDIMTLAKALGNGLPIGAMLAKKEVADAFTPGSHASTFGGTPIVTAAALEVLKVFEKENIVDHAMEMGTYLKEKLVWLKQRHTRIEDVRGMGLLLGMRLNTPGAPIVKSCMENGFLINCIQENILRFIPPLIVTTDEIDSLIACLDDIL